MRSRLLDSKRMDAKTPERVIPMAFKYLKYIVEATNAKEIREWNEGNVCVNTLIESVQMSMVNCYDNLVSADSERDIYKTLSYVQEAANALNVHESLVVSLSDIRWVHLTNKRFIGQSIRELREAIFNWIRFLKRKIRRIEEQAALKSQPKN
ncbi:MAG: hypothetical protein NC548_05325 [Lachnospiraceae bacterium]|nr:hypothetical protein [Lachnospiraceae bacterium]